MNTRSELIIKYIPKEKQLRILIIIICGLIPVILGNYFVSPSNHKIINIKNFRYGKDPSLIHCNHGDTLYIRLSSLDTGHSFFLEEFDIDAKITPANNQILLYSISDPTKPPLLKTQIVLVANYTGIFKSLISKFYYRCHVWCGPMHAFEHGSLVIAPNNLLYLGLGLIFGLLINYIIKIKILAFKELSKIENKYQVQKDIFNIVPWIKKIVKKRWIQPLLMFLSAILLYIVLLTTVFGTQMSGRNLGVLLIWTVWLFMIITFFTPVGGRIWCMACPIPMIGEFLQRRAITFVRMNSNHEYINKFFGFNLTWPKFLQNGWLRLILFLITATFSTTLVAKPITTGIIILILVIVATVMALIWKLRTFCQYLCPINAFIGLYSKLGKIALRKTDKEVCEKCKPFFCEKGSFNGWACPYSLNVKNINDNFDCGLCTECVKSCLYDNVSIYWRKFGSEISIDNFSLAWTSMVMFIISIAYTIVYLGPWSRIRDYVNILDKGNWDLFALYSIVLWLSALIVFPTIFWFISKISIKISNLDQKPSKLMMNSISILIPLGLFIWVAFIIQMLFVNISFIGQSLSDPFGWGWNLLGLAGSPWHQLLPWLIPWIQVACILVGFVYSTRNLLRLLIKFSTNKMQLFKAMIPHSLFLWIVSIALIWFYSN